MDEKPGMPHINEENVDERALGDRREFLKKAGKIAVTAPAAALLLSMAAKRASAVPATSVSDSFNNNP